MDNNNNDRLNYLIKDLIYFINNPEEVKSKNEAT